MAQDEAPWKGAHEVSEEVQRKRKATRTAARWAIYDEITQQVEAKKRRMAEAIRATSAVHTTLPPTNDADVRPLPLVTVTEPSVHTMSSQALTSGPEACTSPAVLAERPKPIKVKRT
jgi:hypothetical protein